MSLFDKTENTGCYSTNFKKSCGVGDGALRPRAGWGITDDSSLTGYSIDTYGCPLNFHTGDGVLGSYDNLRLVGPNSDVPWMRSGPNPKYPANQPMYIPQGTPLPLASEVVPMNPNKDSMFNFAYNYASPQTCQSSPSQYSTDRGCVALTNNQVDFMGRRGGNK